MVSESPSNDESERIRSLDRIHREIEELERQLPHLEQELANAQEGFNKADVIRRHVLKNPERFSPNERENVFQQAQAMGERRIQLDTVLEATRERLMLLRDVEPLVSGEVSASGLSPSSILDLHQAIEAERVRIARELHDGPAQILSDLVLEADILERLLRRDPSLVVAELEDFKQSVTSAVADMRRVMFNLRPLSLDDLGLIATMKGFVTEYKERTGIACTFQVVGEEKRLPPEIEEILYRIIQEALTNVSRHSQATSVEVELVIKPDRVSLRIQDDGIGFDPASVGEEGGRRQLGLAGMQERVAALGGTFQMNSSVGGGTKLQIGVIMSAPGVQDTSKVRKDKP